MRSVILFILLTFTTYSKGQTKNPFMVLKFDKVIIYDYEQSGENPALVSNGQILSSVKIRKEIRLDQATVDQLNIKLGDRKSYGNNHADCFEPHLGIVYYLRNRIVADVLICLDCNRLSSSLDIPALKQGKQGNGADIYYTLDGFSKFFRQFLNDLLKRYKLSHQVPAGSIFDP